MMKFSDMSNLFMFNLNGCNKNFQYSQFLKEYIIGTEYKQKSNNNNNNKSIVMI